MWRAGTKRRGMTCLSRLTSPTFGVGRNATWRPSVVRLPSSHAKIVEALLYELQVHQIELEMRG